MAASRSTAWTRTATCWPSTRKAPKRPDGSRTPPAFFGGADRASATRIPLAEGSAIELDRPFVLPAPLATRTFTVAVTCRDGSVPPAPHDAGDGASGAVFAEFDETGDGPVRTLKLVRDQAYTLLVSIFIPAGPERPWRGVRREEKLPPTELPAGAPGRHIALVAPFTNCAESSMSGNPADEPLFGERGILERKNCDAEPTMRSLTSENATEVRFVNTRVGPIRLYWLDFEGHRQLYSTLASGQSLTQPTYATHPWVVTDENAVCLGTFLARRDPATATIK